MENNDDGLFRLVCACEMIYAPESYDNCPACGAGRPAHKEMLLDIDKFYERVFSLQDKNVDSAMDVIMDVFSNLWDKYDLMDKILEKGEVSKMTGSVMCGILTNTFKYSEQVPNHKIFFQKVCDEYTKRGATPEKIRRTLSGLEGDDNYWESMGKLGATGLIWGPNPNK